MEKWVQLMMAIVSLLRVLLEFPEAVGKWKKRLHKRGSRKNKTEE